MSEAVDDPKAAKVSSLLQEGLECYGTGDVARAFLAWNEALELDPDNEEALDYIRDADRRTRPRGEERVVESQNLVDEARRVLRAADAESALELMVSVGAGESLENETMIELLRASVFLKYREQLGDPARVPRLVDAASADLKNRNLPASAGFLLSMIDGQTSLGDLFSVSGMDRFDAMRSLYQMLQAGILEWVE